MTNIHQVNQRVRQDCPLSPLLFCLFISDLDYTLSLKSSSTGKITMDQDEISVIMFVDDLVLLADSSEGLQQSLSVFQDYCNSWQLKINKVKSKATIYTRVCQSLQYWFFINEEEIKIVTSIKYLGLVLKSNGSLKPAIATLTNQAKKVLFTLMHKVVYFSLSAAKIIDSLITPILEYSCQIWGHMTLNNTEIELIHQKICEFTLNVPSSATNISVYGELGRIPLKIRRNILLIKYWLHLSTSHNISPILWACYRTHQQFNSLWLLHVHSILNHCGLSYIYDYVSRLDCRACRSNTWSQKTFIWWILAKAERGYDTLSKNENLQNIQA